MITIDEMQDMLEQIAEEVPEVFFQELNGGILLLPEAVESPESRRRDLYTLGEYIVDPVMGQYIAIYYGSFCQVFRNEPEAVLKEELRETLFHEFTHHMEGMAGVTGLDQKDADELQEYLAEDQGGYIMSPKLRGCRRSTKKRR